MAVRHLYVHIPFCRSRCAYCDFASEPVGPHARAGRVAEYLACLREELAAVTPLLEAPVDTVYLGGGTPTILPRTELLGVVRGLAALQIGNRTAARLREVAPPEVAPPEVAPPDVAPLGTVAPEFTVEANPGTIDAMLLQDLAEAGVTRISIGIQSFSPRLRKTLGRRVSQREVEECLRVMRAAHWDNWNVDLIHGIPGQTLEEAAADLDRAVEAGPSHISLYDLTYSRRYRDRVKYRLGPAALGAGEAFAEEHYAVACGRLITAGFTRYEVSNFARPGFECRHNLAYWQAEDYVGIGAAAVSTVGLERRCNRDSVADYVAGAPPHIEMLSGHTRTWEKAILGLRTATGVDEQEVRTVLDGVAAERLLRQGCLERACGKLRLNPGFLDVSNYVISALLVSPEGQ